MKAWFLLAFLGFSCVATSVYARPNVTCRAHDKGWEEHFGGHRSCDDCLRKHGKCVESCTLEYSTCEATGIDSLGASFTVKGSGDDRWEAERNALAHCDRNFRNCSVRSCDNKSENVSERRCEPRVEPTPPPPRPTPTPPPPRPTPTPTPPRPTPPPPRPTPPPVKPKPEKPKPEKPKPGKPGRPNPHSDKGDN